jgi:uncharacterized protein YggU (UPF0235/DUF167 family)
MSDRPPNLRSSAPSGAPSGPTLPLVAKVNVWVRPGSRKDSLTWDVWRHRWVVNCRAPATEGEANRSVLDLFQAWLDVPRVSVRWASAGRSAAKRLEVEGLTDAEAERRLRQSAEPDRDDWR